MPRIKQSEAEKRHSRFSADIVKWMYLHEKTNGDMADYLGISKRTFITKKQNPQLFRLGELERMAQLFNLSISTTISSLTA